MRNTGLQLYYNAFRCTYQGKPGKYTKSWWKIGIISVPNVWSNSLGKLYWPEVFYVKSILTMNLTYSIGYL